jgi:hypothetical protein
VDIKDKSQGPGSPRAVAGCWLLVAVAGVALALAFGLGSGDLHSRHLICCWGSRLLARVFHRQFLLVSGALPRSNAQGGGLGLGL